MMEDVYGGAEFTRSPGATGAPAPGAALRHPQDPEERRSSKAGAVLALGIVGLFLMLCGGGLAPAIAGLVLAGPARGEIRASAGFLTGERTIKAGTLMCWIALLVSVVVVVVVVVGLLISTVGSGPHYGENVN
jgi:hypothetical protein